MTRTLGKQINDPRTKYNRLSLSVSPGVSSTSISAATLNARSVSGISGGSDEDVAPRVISTNSEPFAVVSGSISVRIDSGTVFIVSLLNTDNNASLIAKKINAAVGASIASFFNGRLMIKSNGTVGPTGTLTLANVSGTILTTLGLPEGVTSGSSANTRGILTNAGNDNGGYVPLRLVGKQALVTNAGGFVQSSDDDEDIFYNPLLPGGSPIHGRLSFDGTNYQLGYFTSIPANAEINTVGADFTAISENDIISVTVTSNGNSHFAGILFQAGPNTRDTVINRINSQWASSLGSTGRVVVRGTITQPYTFNNEIVHISVNGGAEVPVTFTAGDSTMAAVISKLSAVTGLSPSSIATSSGSVLVLTTTTGTGFSSTISLRDDAALGSNALAKLGVTGGLYVGPHIAKPRGAFEITFFAPNRGARSKIVIATNGVPATATRLGLSSVTTTVTASNDEVDIPVVLPSLTDYGQSPDADQAAITTYQIEAIFPEVLSFGEIPTDYISEQEEYDGASTASNNDPRRDFAILNSLTFPKAFGNDLKNAGQVVVAGPDGLIAAGQMRKASDLVYKYLKQFASGNFDTGLLSGLIANRIMTTGSENNELTASPSMTFNIDQPENFVESSRKLEILFGDTAAIDYRFTPSLLTVNGGINLGTLFSTSLTPGNVTPKAVFNLAASSSRQLVWQTEVPLSSTRGRIRVYSFPGTSGIGIYEIVNNAAWDGSNWTKDVASGESTIFQISGNSTGVRFRHENGGSATFSDSAFLENFVFPTNPIVGDENRFEKMLRLGQSLLDSGTNADSETARINTDYTATKVRTLLWQMDSESSQPSIRIYAASAARQSVYAIPGIEITYNARWVAASALWFTDSVNSQATKFFLGEAGFALKTTGSFPTVSFDDTDTAAGWRKTSGLTGSVGASSNERPPTALLWKAVNAISNDQIVDLFFPGPFILHSNTITSDPKANALHANLVPKITGRVAVNAGSVGQFEGFGVQVPTVFGAFISFPYFHAPDFQSQVVFQTQMMLAGGPANTHLIALTNPSTYTFMLVNTATGATVNWSTSNFAFSFAVYYEHTP